MADDNRKGLQEKIYSYFKNNPDLRVLFIFREDGSLSMDGEFDDMKLDEMEWDEGYRYVRFRGNEWFTCKYRFDNEWKDDKVILFIDSPSPLNNKKEGAKFPLMDLLVANAEFKREDYASFMQSNNIPEGMAAFVKSNLTLLQSGKMEGMLEQSYKNGSISEDVATRAILSMFLSKGIILEWREILVQVLMLGVEKEEKKRVEFFRRTKGAEEPFIRLDSHFKDILGIGIELNSDRKVEKLVQVLKYNAIVQNLTTTETDSYKSYKIGDSKRIAELNGLLDALRRQEAFETLMEELGKPIKCDLILSWYGVGADYHYIPDDLLQPILQSILEEEHISEDPQRVLDRMNSLKMKLSEGRRGDAIIDFIVQAASFYNKVEGLNELGLAKVTDPNEYISLYKRELCKIDMLYRHAIETFYQFSSHPLYEVAHNVKSALDSKYVKLTNDINSDWLSCLVKSGGISSLVEERQWKFYDNRVGHMSKKVVVIVSDALRYEMADELTTEMSRSKHRAELFSEIATLPTETKYCKPSLMPHKSLNLAPGEKEINMTVDGDILDSTESRSKHLQGYKEGALCETFVDVVKSDKNSNRELFKSPVVYLYHDHIDNVGHKSSAKDFVDGCREAIKEIADLVPKIHATYNVTEVIITSDHGFLFNDIEFQEKDKHTITESASDILEHKNRYYLTKSDAEMQGVVKFPLSEVSGMSEVDGVMVAVPVGTNRFGAPSGGYMFAHGGASLQELVVPVIVSTAEREDSKKPVDVQILENNLSIQSSRLRFHLVQMESVGADAKERVVSVALYHNDRAVTEVKEIKFDKINAKLDERQVLVDLKLNGGVDAKLLHLKMYDVTDMMNPIFDMPVTNNTLIANDFEY